MLGRTKVNSSFLKLQSIHQLGEEALPHIRHPQNIHLHPCLAELLPLLAGPHHPPLGDLHHLRLHIQGDRPGLAGPPGNRQMTGIDQRTGMGCVTFLCTLGSQFISFKFMKILRIHKVQCYCRPLDVINLFNSNMGYM